MFKKVIRKVVIAHIVVVAMFGFRGTILANPVGEYYTFGRIKDVIPEKNLTILVDEEGQRWKWCGATFNTPNGPELLRRGYKVVIALNGHGTHKPNDDCVIDFEIYKR